MSSTTVRKASMDLASDIEDVLVLVGSAARKGLLSKLDMNGPVELPILHLEGPEDQLLEFIRTEYDKVEDPTTFLDD